MIVIPAVDLKDGKCVRLSQGDFGRSTVYADDPMVMARKWQEQGAERIHLVDLDGSLAGAPKNSAQINAIVREVPLPVQVGGGIRNRETIENYLTMGVQWIILGTAALRDEKFVREACRAYEGRIILGIDAANGKVAVQGWTEETFEPPQNLARRYEQEGIAAIIYTDIKRDGMGTGVNLEATKALAQAVRIPVIASGGVAGIEDIKNLKDIEAFGVTGVIVGKALYSGALSLSRAIKEAAHQEEAKNG
ncbi:MAG: 1-(5-phosphoribosyl)-5-[(5-phosphoribosylamino)methylideneamino]imidazole-4-carboxamide isomerase [Syntrophales bacterium LBB04]|nr:1-(5-phosphoribosyl)-5-[(5-phosphoribosylamino)methylideneamino]imidazole-4-carboxamide isomerase [Syntrophales bacterium LBB04]